MAWCEIRKAGNVCDHRSTHLIIEHITSTANPRIKAASSLRDARERRESGLMIIDGLPSSLHAHHGGIQCTELFIREAHDESHRHLVQQWEQLVPDIRINILSAGAMSKLQYGDRDESLVAIARQPSVAIESLVDRIKPSSKRLFLVLDQVEKPGNLGAAMRTADAAGVSAVLLSDPISEPWNPNAIRASLGALFRVPLAIGSSKQVHRWLVEQDVDMRAARVEGACAYTEVPYSRGTAIIVGNEAEGLADRWQEPDVQPVRIPMHGVIDSLNVSVSISILLFEVLRQWASSDLGRTTTGQ